MDAESKRYYLIQWLNQVNDPTTLDQVEKIARNSQPKDWWETISDAEKTSIQRGYEQAENGELIPHSEVQSQLRNKLGL